MKKTKTMTVKQAFDRAIKKNSFTFGKNGHFFAMVGWLSEDAKRRSGPFFVSVNSDTAIEIDRKGKFKDRYSSYAEGYFPWVEESK